MIGSTEELAFARAKWSMFVYPCLYALGDLELALESHRIVC